MTKMCVLIFCIEMQERFAVDGFVQSLIFSDEATFHLSGRVNRHNVRIWVTENLLAVVENVRDSPKPNIFCSISNEKVYGPFFFEEPTVNGMLYSHMLENWLMPQLNEDSNKMALRFTITKTCEGISIETYHKGG